jgi:hypothetical protein
MNCRSALFNGLTRRIPRMSKHPVDPFANKHFAGTRLSIRPRREFPAGPVQFTAVVGSQGIGILYRLR